MSQITVEAISIEFNFCKDGVIFEAVNKALNADVDELSENLSLLPAWVEQIKPGETLFDIGSGAGAGAILAAKSHGTKVLAFESDAQKYALLNRNIRYNGLEEHIRAYCLSISNQCGLGRLTGGSWNQQGTLYQCLDSLGLDEIASPPEHIKITVGRDCYRVLTGMTELLKSPSLRSVFIRLDASAADYQDIVALLNSSGLYCYDRINKYYLGRATLGDGGGSGCNGERVTALPACNIFSKDVDRLKTGGKILNPLRSAPSAFQKLARDHLIERIRSAKIIHAPYYYCVIDHLFPENFYHQLMECKPSIVQMAPISEGGTISGGGYRDRFSFELEDKPLRKLGDEQRHFIEEFISWFLGEEVLRALLELYKPFIQQQNIKNIVTSTRGLFTKDLLGYSIAPHTDSPRRLITGMFYIPSDSDHTPLGTSVYTPKQQGFKCEGEKHHQFEKYDLATTASYKPNSAFFFLKSLNSFHGVAPITVDYERDCIVYVIKNLGVEPYH